MWLAKSRKPTFCLCQKLVSRRLSTVASPKPQGEDKSDTSQNIKIASHTPSTPPLVRSLLARAASLLSKQKRQNNSDDPDTSLFIRHGSAQQANNLGLEFLVNVKKYSERCPLDPPQSVTPVYREKLSPSQRLEMYLALGKARLSALVVLTTSFGYGLAVNCSPTLLATTPLGHFTTFATVTAGTALLAGAANTINQFMEAPYDSQMPRTRNRPLAVRTITPEHALTVGIGSSLIGITMLALTTNPITTVLGIANLVLYTSIYTPMKRKSAYNTWVGAIVGTLPPLMGWAAATGGELHHGAYVLAAILFAWQFPHFMALSWNMKGEYARAGYQVQAVVDPPACRRAALRHSWLLTGLCSFAVPATLLAPLSFAFLSLPVNIQLLRLASRFRRNADAASARSLFHYSLIYLPSIMVLLLATGYFGK